MTGRLWQQGPDQLLLLAIAARSDHWNYASQSFQLRRPGLEKPTDGGVTAFSDSRNLKTGSNILKGGFRSNFRIHNFLTLIIYRVVKASSFQGLIESAG
jgi:hypothetical protein